MTDPGNAHLQRRIDELEAENSRLREPADESSRHLKRSWAWTLLAAVLITIGALLAPVAVIASWSKTELTDTGQFVAAYAPLAKDPEVQAYVTDEIIAVINERVDVEELTTQVIDGIIALGTGPAATDALNLLKGPAATGVENLIRNGVTRFVESDAFANVWAAALRVSHTQLVAAMQNDPDAALTISREGAVGIQLGPIIEEVKAALLRQGIDIASRIPPVDRTIEVAQSDALPTVQVVYGLTVTLGTWLPWIAILLLTAGVLVARRRVIALIWAAVALALAMILTLSAFAVGNVAFTSAVSQTDLPVDVASLLYETVADDMRATAIAVLVLALAVAVVAWMAGPFEVPRRLRALAREGAGRLRGSAERHGVTTGRTGEWLYEQRVLLRVLIGAVAAIVVLFVRPLTPGLVIWTLVLAVIVLWILELVQRPVVTVPAESVSTSVTTEP